MTRPSTLQMLWYRWQNFKYYRAKGFSIRLAWDKAGRTL